MNAGLPEYFSFPPSSQGAVRLAVLPSGLWLKLGMSTVASPRGIEAAWSNEMFSGIYKARLQGHYVGCCYSVTSPTCVPSR